MAKKPVITPVASGQYDPVAINNNLNKIATAFENTLSRDGSTPNQMQADLDMNGRGILNVERIGVEGITLQGQDISEVLIGATEGAQELYDKVVVVNEEVDTNLQLSFDYMTRAEDAKDLAEAVELYVQGVYPEIQDAHSESLLAASTAVSARDTTLAARDVTLDAKDDAVLAANTATSAAGPLQGGLAGQVLRKQTTADYAYEWATISGTGDMTEAVYDPQGIREDAFNMDFMEDGTAKVAMTVGEREAVANITTSGLIHIFGGSIAPSGFLLCDGAAVSRVDYASLFAVIGTTYGVGDGSATFNVPNIQGRVPVGVGAGYGLGATGGAATVALTEAQMPNHTHTFSGTTSSNGGHSHTYAQGPIGRVIASGSSTSGFVWAGTHEPYRDTSAVGNHNHTFSGTTAARGSGQAHENMQPYIVLNYIIKV